MLRYMQDVLHAWCVTYNAWCVTCNAWCATCNEWCVICMMCYMQCMMCYMQWMMCSMHDVLHAMHDLLHAMHDVLWCMMWSLFDWFITLENLRRRFLKSKQIKWTILLVIWMLFINPRRHQKHYFSIAPSPPLSLSRF